MTQGWRKTIKRIVIIVLSVLLIVTGAGWYFLSRWESIALNELKESTEEVTGGLYHLDVGKIKINLFSGYLSARNIIICPDTNRLAYLHSVDSLPDNYASIHIQSIELDGVNFKKKTKDRGRSLDFSLIAVNSPQIRITNTGFTPSTQDTLGSKPPKTLYEMIAPVFERVSVGEIRLNNGKIEYNRERSTDTTMYVMENIRLHAEKFVIDSTSYLRNHILYCEDFHFYIENAHHLLPGGSYTLDIGKIGLGIKDSVLSVEKVALVPQYSKQEFAYKDAGHSDWMDLKVGKLVCRGVDFQDIIINRRINMDSVRIEDVDFQTFKNQKIVIKHHKMPLLYEQFQRLPLPVDIRNVQVNNLNVHYEELSKNGHLPGLIRFTEIYGEFQGITNVISSHKQMNKLVARGKLMNEGQINAMIYFPVDSLNDRFEITGTLGPMRMQVLNSIIEPMAPARIKGGFIRGIDYYIIGGKHRASINMQLLYNDLSVEILKENNDHSKSNQSIYSLLANGFIKHDNPDKGKEPRRVQTEWERDPYHSSFNYLWKIYFSGLVETVGFTKEKKDRISWFKQEIEKLKSKKK